MNLEEAVKAKIKELGNKKAAEFFGVSTGMISGWAKGSKAITLKAAQKLVETAPVASPAPELEQEEQEQPTGDLSGIQGTVVDPLLAGSPFSPHPKPELTVKVEKRSKANNLAPASDEDALQWEGKKLIVLRPTFRHSNPRTDLCFAAIWDKSKMGVIPQWASDPKLVRNDLVSQFLKNRDAVWSLWLDDDIVFPFGNAAMYKIISDRPTMGAEFAGVHGLARLLSHGKSIVGGVYSERKTQGKAVIAEVLANDRRMVAKFRRPTMIIEKVEWMGLGFMLVNRQVYLDIMEQFPDRPKDALGRYNFFDSQGETDSAAFGRLAASAGHDTYADCGVQCGHEGTKVYNLED